MNLFTAQINNWQDWARIYQEIPVWQSLAEYILKKENLSLKKIEHLTPGTNAVFKVGSFVIKIFAPIESGYDQSTTLQTEIFATERANALGISSPKLIAKGLVKDKYSFGYIITEYIDGVEFAEAVKTMTDDEKIMFGQKLRKICDKMNTPCRPFNDIDVINDEDRQIRFKRFPKTFQEERTEYIKSHDFGEKVFVHGDIGGDNTIISPDGEIFLIDFADAVLAPVIYEYELIAVDVFTFDPALLYGFFGKYTADELTEICFNGILIHDFGGSTIKEHIGNPDEFTCLEDLRKRLRLKIKEGESTNYVSSK